jgi:hypothetical protein
MSEELNNGKTPRVFVSYSHDSEAHSAWVLELATRLRKCGVEVLLDQWDLGPGDDVPKYMEMAVSDSDRVLMVCTEPYVRKADEGKGGVGYETMIVTGELVKNLGTNKFIPIIRQGVGDVVVPKSVSTRLYVNLSDAQNFEAGLEKLVREVHETPKAHKPPLGKNPYSSVAVEATAPANVAEVKIEDAEAAYLAGYEIASNGDFKAWRELVRRVKDPLSARLNAWRKKYDGLGSMLIADLPGMVLDAATIYSPLMAVALGGVESGNSKFTNQGALLDEFVRPRDWNASGLTVIGAVPDALVFTYQALHGATCAEIGELGLAMSLSRARVTSMYSSDGEILHSARDLIGWPVSFNHTCTMAWDYLTKLDEKWPWLKRIFGSREDYQAAIAAYYMALSIQELALLLADGHGKELDNPDLRFGVPVMWMRMSRELQQKAYRKLLFDEPQLRKIWRSVGVRDKAIADSWPKWMDHTCGWMAHVDQFGMGYGKPVYSVLFEDLKPEDDKP